MGILGDLRSLIGEDLVLDPESLGTRAAGIGRPEKMVAAAMARPKTTEQVSAILRWCNSNGVKVVPYGGNSGLVRGTLSRADDVVLSLELMNRIENIDGAQRSALVQAGVVLQHLNDAVSEHGLIFPLDLGGRGSATVGGNASTNAGGNRVIRFGMMRDMTLGVEAVLADGTIVSSLRPFIKNNTGYDLKHLFIGSEGTLGVITRLMLRLRERPAESNVAFVASDSFAGMVGMLRHMDRALGGTLSAFEVMWNSFYRLVTSPPAIGRPPLSQDYPFYMLIEALGAGTDQFNAALEGALGLELINDAVIAQSQTECTGLWSLRDDMSQLNRHGVHITFDISLPAADMERYTQEVAQELPDLIGDHQLYIFGHLGDGNLHVVVGVSLGVYPEAKAKVEQLVYGKLKAIGGSVSAEHGIGLDKKSWLPISRSEAEIALMRAIKQALDPMATLNPGKIL
ncbi:FAD-binding oxidoreductase [Neoaquamicrobium sediminum]|uniref:FAD-binding oxidoreductase n=1 Tax=Neoaquamicrobium sediminum TaxID=1849104 RepID=UPI0036063F68